ncbi:globoside alpha-1,3-N-acetylgalactosaminyltransferase 1-like [Poecilia latipinna]|uniref:globoside alpha-1,3-N-acetylgalactosaminyltransferase 1-like n=1 Tax=Poecilia latipinna TaxID=48699 RepID=UPI00072E5A73|nr:PREDICTED: globoside alpha-1,3-N-acetylgalactosaminyltransferase 1-like [Poecilia latipinna]
MILVSLCLHRFVYGYFRESFTSMRFCNQVCVVPVVPEKDLFDLENKLDEIDRNEDGQCQKSSCKMGEMIMESGLKYAQPSTLTGRSDVNAVTNWNVPLVWEGTFDPVVIDAIYKRINPRIAVVVFAVGKYTRFLQKFIETGEKYFFVGFNLTYYVHTDRENEVPKVSCLYFYS